MEYDYGAGWGFEIELLSMSEMKRGAGTHYPYVTDGNGRGIIEDISPYELAEIVTKTDMNGILPQIMDMYANREISWDYRKLDLKYCNAFLKNDVWKIQNAYEVCE
ncbi:pRiA4b ORF-3-like protein [Pectinatus cerevisiiphilus]|uniref:PRiA4b ORF-3-like protein n=2 Tax=Pectinatus cerevisiiphilus TaxID=86956 RepID=A0A4R3K4G2_9FIRM|nr:pRiA4b ORF-3-like protein [Pectinatus cerevisiiphilus]